jgi:tetratricopeptide (TPR) repeat protein
MTITNSGSGAIATHGGVAAGAGGVAIGGNMYGNIIYQLPPNVELKGSRLPGRNPLFVGRVKTLDDLAALLANESALVVMTAPGGMGKTQTSIELGHRYADHFPGGVFFLNCLISDISLEIAQCGSDGRLPLDDFDSRPHTDKVNLVLSEWRKPIARLIIMDSAEDPQVVKQWRSVIGGACRLLVTARRGAWSPSLTPHIIHLPQLDRPDSLRLLAQNNETCAKDFANDPSANTIAESLGDLPLALHCAGAYIAHYALTPAQYLSELRGRSSSLLHDSLGDWLNEHESLPTDHTPNVIATFELSYEKIKNQLQTSNIQSLISNLPLRLFHLLAHCAPATPLPREVLATAANLDDDKKIIDALHALSNVGLVTLDVELRPIIHRLAQEFSRLRAPAPDDDATQMENVVEHKAEKINEAGFPKVMEPFLAHLQTLAERAEVRESQKAGSLFDNAGYHFNTIANYSAARAAYERALAIDEKSFGADHPNIAIHINNLGIVYKYMGNFPAARAAYERALAIDEKSFGADHPNVAICVNNLGEVYRVIGDLPAARAAFERALAILEKVLGIDHPNVAILVNNLGMVYKDMGDLPAARAAFERALAIGEKSFGVEHPHVATFVNNLGGVYDAMGDLPAARAAFERALAIDEKAFGIDHPDVARDVNNIGNVYYALGNFPVARAAYERALAIDEKTFGVDHPNIAIRVNNLSAVYQDMNDLPAACAAFQRALTIDEKTFGADHPNTAKDINNLGTVYKAMGDLPKARAHFQRALAIMEKCAPNSPYIKIARENLERVPRG